MKFSKEQYWVQFFSVFLLMIFTLEGNIVSFTDDTAIFYQADYWIELKEKVENELLTYVFYLLVNLLHTLI